MHRAIENSRENDPVTIAGFLLIFRQAFRSVAILLLPIAFASLIVWATAGSSSGSTSDPIFTSLWFWLAAHQVPLDIYGSMADAKLSFLPLGALALVFFAVRSGTLRSIQYFEERQRRIVVPTFALSYVGLIMVITLIASTREEVISVRWYLALPITLLITLFSSLIAARLMPARTRAPWEIAAAWAATALAALLALATLLFLISLAVHYRAVIDLSTVISPGIFGGVAFIAIQLLYFPNMVVATLGYISGSGAHIGADSIIHPLIFELDQLPAIPLLGALPRGTFPWAMAGVAIVIGLGFLIHRRLRARFGDDLSAAIALAVFFLLSLVLALSASGQLISDVLGEVGPSWWRFPLVLSGELALGMALSRLMILIRDRRTASNQELQKQESRGQSFNEEREAEREAE